MRSFDKATQPLTDTEPRKETDATVRVSVLSPDELANLIFEKNSEPQDRFKNPNEGGVFKLFYYQDLLDERERTSRYIVLFEGDVIVGIGKLRKSPGREDTYEPSVSIDPNFQNKGYGKKILEKQFEMAKEMGWKLNAIFTPEGNKRLRKTSATLVKKYNIEGVEEPW